VITWGSTVRQTWVKILALRLSSCLTSDKNPLISLNLFSHLLKEFKEVMMLYGRALCWVMILCKSCPHDSQVPHSAAWMMKVLISIQRGQGPKGPEWSGTPQRGWAVRVTRTLSLSEVRALESLCKDLDSDSSL
jgi:hypothetical protein